MNILTGDRPTGRLHLGHYVGSLRERVRMQNEEVYDNFFVMIADSQALTDNSGNPQKVRNNIIELMLDYLSVGLNPEKITFFIQSYIKALPEITQYYMNLVTLPRLLRNPTVKSETKQKGYSDSASSKGIPVGFANYPISQAADITTFKASIVPVGDDQLPMIEQTKEIVKSFNSTYKEVLVMPKPVVPKDLKSARLPGIDGNAKMSKSLNNCIYLSDSSEEVREKVFKMYTDPNHLKVTDPGKVEGNMVFVYLDVFSSDDHFKKYLKEFKNLDDLKKQYQIGGVGDVKIKKFLYDILEETLEPIRKRRQKYENDIEYVYKVLKEGTAKANLVAEQTLKEIKDVMEINYFDDPAYLLDLKAKYAK